MWKPLLADRTDPDAVRRALGGRTWDAVIDTWAWAQREHPAQWFDPRRERHVLEPARSRGAL